MILNQLAMTADSCGVCAAPFDGQTLSVWSAAARASICLGCVDASPATAKLIVPARVRPIVDPAPVTPEFVAPAEPAVVVEPVVEAESVVGIEPVVENDNDNEPIADTPTRRPATFAPPIGQPVAVQPPRSSLLDAIVGAATAATAEPATVRIAVTELRNRSVARTRHTIDRLIVTSAGVFVITDRDETGTIDVSSGRRGRRFRINGKDRTRTLRTSELLTDAVSGALAHLGRGHIDVVNVHCFSEATVQGDEMLEADGVKLMTTGHLDALLSRPGDMSVESIAGLAVQLAERFPALSRD